MINRPAASRTGRRLTPGSVSPWEARTAMPGKIVAAGDSRGANFAGPCVLVAGVFIAEETETGGSGEGLVDPCWRPGPGYTGGSNWSGLRCHDSKLHWSWMRLTSSAASGLRCLHD